MNNATLTIDNHSEMETISSYSRATGIEDGILVDVSETAREAGIRFPVAMTREVWGKYVEVPEGVTYQDEKGRLWDILYMMARAAKRSSGDRITFQVYVHNNNHKRLNRNDLMTLVAVVGPGDSMEPVITIMLIGQD